MLSLSLSLSLSFSFFHSLHFEENYVSATRGQKKIIIFLLASTSSLKNTSSLTTNGAVCLWGLVKKYYRFCGNMFVTLLSSIFLERVHICTHGLSCEYISEKYYSEYVLHVSSKWLSKRSCPLSNHRTYSYPRWLSPFAYPQHTVYMYTSYSPLRQTMRCQARR